MAAEHAPDRMRARCLDPLRRPRTYMSRGERKVVETRDEYGMPVERTIPASDYTVKEWVLTSGSRVWVCVDCPAIATDWQEPDALGMAVHLIEHSMTEGGPARVSSAGLTALVCQAVYDAGFDGDYR